MKRILLLFSFATSLFAGKIEIIKVESKLTNKIWDCTVAMPDSMEKGKRVKQIYLLHGAGGHHKTWSSLNKLDELADKYNRIIIAPTVGRVSWYNNHNKSEDYIIKELIPFIDKKYKTLPNRWISGLSMGGYGAIRLGIKYPKLFSAYGGQSPCITPSQWTHKWGIATNMGPTAKEGKDDHFATKKAIARMVKDKRPFSILCGKQDFFYKECQAAYEKLKKAGKKVYWEDLDGAHNGKFWSKSVLLHLEFFQKFERK